MARIKVPIESAWLMAPLAGAVNLVWLETVGRCGSAAAAGATASAIWMQAGLTAKVLGKLLWGNAGGRASSVG